MDLNGKTVLITGASSGVGAAIARAASRAGAAVVLLARNDAALRNVAAEIAGRGGTARWYAVDLTDPAATQSVCERVEREAGTPDVIVNNAGAGRFLWPEETEPADVSASMAAPYFAAFFVTRAFLPRMIERNSGTIVNVTSVAAFAPWAGATAYTAARWAMRGFNEALRADLHESRIRVMLAAFAKIDTPYFDNNPGSAERLPRAQALVRVLKPDEAARAIVRGVERDRSFVTAPGGLRWLLGLARHFPSVARLIQHGTSYPRSSGR